MPRKYVKRANHYINNKDLYQAFCEWKQPREPSNIPKYICEAIMMITKNLANDGRFRGYPMRSEMEGNALVSLVKGVKNFDETRFNNPFAFITQIAYNAFITEINKEHQRLQGMTDYRKHIASDSFEEFDEEDDNSNVKNRLQNKSYDAPEYNYSKPKKLRKKPGDWSDVFFEEDKTEESENENSNIG